MATINSWSNTITAAGSITTSTNNGAIIMNSGTGTISIGTDATAATYNIASGAEDKLVTLGTTNTSSSLALKTGTADYTLASATGTVMSSLDTGETSFALQSAFLSFNSASDLNVTGDGTVYQIICNTEVYDQNSDYDGTTGIFTAPITAKYHFAASISLLQLTTSSTIVYGYFIASNRQATMYRVSGINIATGGILIMNGQCFMDMDVADTITMNVQASGITKVVDVQGANLNTSFGGKIVC